MSMMSLSAYRLATVEDAAQVGAFQVHAWRENYADFLPSWVIDGVSVEERVAAWRQILRRPSFHDNAFVVLSGDESGIAALGAASSQRLPRLKALGYTAQIEALYVRKDLQGNGLGRSLLGRLFIELAARGHRAASHVVMSGNTRGAAFLRASGAGRSPCRERANPAIRTGPMAGATSVAPTPCPGTTRAAGCRQAPAPRQWGAPPTWATSRCAARNRAAADRDRRPARQIAVLPLSSR